jgi:hypothetical protein
VLLLKVVFPEKISWLVTSAPEMAGSELGEAGHGLRAWPVDLCRATSSEILQGRPGWDRRYLLLPVIHRSARNRLTLCLRGQ